MADRKPHVRRGDLCVFKRDCWVHNYVSAPSYFFAGTAALVLGRCDFDDEYVEVMLLGFGRERYRGAMRTDALEMLDDTWEIQQTSCSHPPQSAI